MNHHWILNEAGEPVPTDLLTWAAWLERQDNPRLLRQDNVTGEILVSTIFIGLDMGFGGPLPLLFESMILGGAHDMEQRRYATRAEALRGHAELLALAKEEPLK